MVAGHRGQTVHTGPGLVADPHHPSRSDRDGCHEHVGVPEPRLGSNGLLFLQQQHVTRPPGGSVQRNPHGQKGVLCLRESSAVRRGDECSRRLCPVQRMDIPEAPAALLQVRLEQEGCLAGLLMAGGNARCEHGEPVSPPGTPVGRDDAEQVRGQRCIPGKVPGREQRGCGVEVIGRQLLGLLDGTDGVAEFDLVRPLGGIPDRVPEPLRDLSDCLGAVVQQQHIEVAVRRKFAAAVTAGSHESETTLDPGSCRLEEPDQPLVGGIGQRTAQRTAADRTVREHGVAEFSAGNDAHR